MCILIRTREFTGMYYPACDTTTAIPQAQDTHSSAGESLVKKWLNVNQTASPQFLTKAHLQVDTSKLASSGLVASFFTGDLSLNQKSFKIKF